MTWWSRLRPWGSWMSIKEKGPQRARPASCKRSSENCTGCPLEGRSSQPKEASRSTKMARKAAHSAPARHMSFCWCCMGATSWTPALVTLPAKQPTFTLSALCWRRSCAPTSLLPWDTSSSSSSLVLPSARRLSRSSLIPGCCCHCHRASQPHLWRVSQVL